jgi:hypothetical protein
VSLEKCLLRIPFFAGSDFKMNGWSDTVSEDQVQQKKRLTWIKYLWQHATTRNLSWFLTWIICSVGCFYQSVGVVESYLKSETSTSIEYLQMQQLPGVTICFPKHMLLLSRVLAEQASEVHQLSIAQQLNATLSYKQLVISCHLATVNGSQPCEQLLRITEYVTIDQKCISLHEPDQTLYDKRIRPLLAFNRTNLFDIHLNRTLVSQRFDLTIHNLTNSLQVLDHNWIKLNPLRYSAVKIGFKHVQLSLLPLPYDTNCSDYSPYRSKANCLNECFKEEYRFKEELWPPFVPGFNRVKKVLTSNIYIDSGNVSTTSPAPSRSIRSPLDDPFAITDLPAITTLSPFALFQPSVTSPSTNLTVNGTAAKLNRSSLLSSLGSGRLPLRLQNILRKNLNRSRQDKAIGYEFITQKLFIEKSRFNFREETEQNLQRISQSKYSLKGIADIRGHCDHRCDRGRQCDQDIYTPVRGPQLDAGPQSPVYRIEVEPAKFMIRCQSEPKYKRIHLLCFIASTLTLWFGGSIVSLLTHVIKGNLHTIRCLLCCNSAKRDLKTA